MARLGRARLGRAERSVTERAIVDLPGTYSLLARSFDEQVTADAVKELAGSLGEGNGQRGIVVAP